MSPFPLLRLLSHEDFRPGPQLAEALGVSRASVSLALKSAAELGVEVQAVKSRGYKLTRPLDWLDEPIVARQLAEKARFFDLHCFDEIDSTNIALIAKAHASAPSGLCYAAERQTAGRGRRGRVWHGVPGDTLMFSLLWRFNLGMADLSGLSLTVGLAVVRALQKLGIHGAALKWPNDIVTSTGKLGGILIELSGDTLGPSAVVIGIGLNVGLCKEARQAVDQPVDALRSLGYPGDRNTLLAALLSELACLLPAFERDGFAPLRQEWESHHAMQNQAVRLLMPNGDVLQGTARGVNTHGALRFETENGEQQFHSGEISLRSAI
ncbi:biotin--[acetyl-CoA-carboxylase] ligase [Chitinimonas sp. BJB300]|uniref:biotin--[acetyl-CoA-carboxylase] ligase n=1 Tax=Chitinimonas sp. BJB300 TaxID=1559339 RepID=UPI000C0F4368|nr:biotin--[acetyl-CoA-carboxylase] ligase [Chitinimonas sp. BJB300]PHV11904.1 biotin--[acetyl-CoA-carboxylase] ligase [Chitinimonas sp. BJB300]TSJ91482.1 biotin--[acetyl-CoA-carboxylase] ligase [Chitinimonas sp. BJB300]